MLARPPTVCRLLLLPGKPERAARYLTGMSLQGDTRMVEPDNPTWVPGTYKPPPGATNDMGDLVAALRAFGEAFTARQAGQARRGQDLMDEARDVLGSAGIRLVLALLRAGRIPYPDAPWWPVFLSELARHDPDEPLWELSLSLIRPGEYLTLRRPSGEALVFRIVQVATE